VLKGLALAETLYAEPHTRLLTDLDLLVRDVMDRLQWLFAQPCLYAALAGYHFLRSTGHDAVIRVGVRTAGDRLLSHAWLTLTVDGVPYLADPQQHGLVEMISYPPPPPPPSTTGPA